MTLEELEDALSNGFHEAEIFSFELDYLAGTAKSRMNLLVGWPADPEPERQAYQETILDVQGLCFCSVDPPFVRNLVAELPAGSWCYRFFVDDSNACINIAGRDAAVTWVGAKPKQAL